MKIFATITTFASIVTAWGINGHLFVAKIAQDLLETSTPSSLNQAIEMLGYLSTYDPYLTAKELDHPFVEAATFADDIKHGSGKWQSKQHFVDTPSLDQGGSIEDFTSVFNQYNITETINSIVQWISAADDGEQVYSSSYVYTYLMALYPKNENLAKSYALRLLIHYMGDIHQPLHCENRFNAANPKGDIGGNRFALPNHHSAANLHSVWDKLIYTQHVNIARPIRETQWGLLQVQSASMVSRNSGVLVLPQTYHNLSVYEWAAESYAIGKDAYANIVQNVALPQWYIDQYVPVSEGRVVLAGYRLAHLIQYMFPSTELFLQ